MKSRRVNSEMKCHLHFYFSYKKKILYEKKREWQKANAYNWKRKREKEVEKKRKIEMTMRSHFLAIIRTFKSEMRMNHFAIIKKYMNNLNTL